MTGDEIAIIGMYCRLPGADNLHEFWDNLQQGKHSISFLNAEEQARLSGSKMAAHPSYVPCKGGTIRHPEHFDAPFFGYAPREAALMDPQVRLFHEGVWSALEDAGYSPHRFTGDIGLYAGASDNLHWKNNILFDSHNLSRDNFTLSQLIDKDFLCSRVAYALNLTGPCYAVQTACSTSLVAVHLACQGILNGECDMAVAGGVSIHYGMEQGYLYKEGAVLSPDGHCRAFDGLAAGTVPGSGLGLVVLKHLEKALEDKDAIYAIIKGSAINNDGNRKAGYTSPSVAGQVKVIRSALDMAEVEPATISYIEAHGTGTQLGDPIEIASLKLAFGPGQPGTCGIGSVKTNIGHLDVAAGVTGLIKTALALQHRRLPPSLNYVSPNTRIDFSSSPFYIVDKLQEWSPAQAGPLRAGVSSFGIGGTNAHVILEEFIPATPAHHPQQESSPCHLVPLSAKTATSLRAAVERLYHYVAANETVSVRALSYTLAAGRSSFPERAALVAAGRDDLMRQLQQWDAAGMNGKQGKAGRPVIFMFSGQGAQYVNMGIDIYRHIPLFKAHLDRGMDLYRSITGKNLKAALYPAEGHTAAPGMPSFHDTVHVQPLLYTFEYAMALTLVDMGIKPASMIGHSIGEYVAASLAGAFTFEEGLQIVARRGALMQQLPAGAMLSVNLGEAAVRPLLPPGVSIAAVNTPQNCVVSGETAQVKALESRLQADGHQCILLKTSHAFHSAMMQPMCEQFSTFLQGFTFKPLHSPFISNISGKSMEAGTVVPASYWVKHILDTVAFSAGLHSLAQQYPDAAFIELGPGHALSTFARKCRPAGSTHMIVNLVKHINQQGSDVQHWLSGLASLWTTGMDMDLEKIFHNRKEQRLHLPAYAFDKHVFNVDTPLRTVEDVIKLHAPEQPAERAGDIYYVPQWEQALPLAPPQKEPAGSWLVFIDEGEAASRLLQALGRHAQQVTCVRTGSAFSEEQPGLFCINPAVKDDYYRLFTGLKERGMIPGKIVHAWTLKDTKHPLLSPERLEEQKQQGFYSLVYLVQAIGALGITGKTDITVISCNSLSVLGNDCKYPERALLYGITKIIPLEYSTIGCRYVDVAMEDLEADPAGTCKRLMDYLLGAAPGPGIAAIRGASTWVRQYRQLPSMDTPAASLLKQDGVYLVTGGMGGMALTIAGHLLRDYKATVVLIGRSPLPGLEQQPGEDARLRLQMLEEMKQAGGKLVLRQADICDREKMSAIVKEVEEEHGPVKGILHTAAVIDHYGAIQKRGRAAFEDSLAAKVTGTLVLHHIFHDKPLDFILFFSSAGTIAYGSKYGEAGYVAANDFLDAVTACPFGKCAVVKSVSWCDWAKVGLSVKSIDRFFSKDPGAKAAALEAFEKEALLPAEGVAAFARVMSNTIPHIIISKTALNSAREKATGGWQQKQALFLKSALKDKPAFKKPESREQYIAPADELQQQIAGIYQQYFGYSEISVHDNIFELGANSLDMAQINELFKSVLQVDIPLVTLFEYPTIQKLAAYIRSAEATVAAPQADRMDRGKNNMSRMRAISKNNQ